jgi:hypothetical protein
MTMANMKQGVREARFVFETEAGNFTRTDIHWMDRVSNAIAQVKNANFALEFLDEKGRVLRKVEFGEPSPEMKQLVEYEFGDEQVGA